MTHHFSIRRQGFLEEHGINLVFWLVRRIPLSHSLLEGRVQPVQSLGVDT